MRVVRSEGEVDAAVESASREAARAFADGAVYVERLIERPRHIEVQVLGDAHGTVVHLFERDCSLQRRHQKVVEESPGPTLSPAVRARITAAAVAAAREVGYVNAGTVEFILEGEGDAARFYFLEMNTRLQVEHPVTELVTGRDLVHAQLRVAVGEPLWFTQDDVTQTGHAVEVRVYAEDASRGLLPQTGTLLRYREPAGDGVRVDSGVVEGQAIGVDYDPMLAKVIAHGTTRDAALDRLRGALREFAVLGIRHNIPFLLRLIDLDDVRANRVDTGLIERRLDELAAPPPDAIGEAAAAIVKSRLAPAAGAVRSGMAGKTPGTRPADTRPPDPWETIAW
jgi:acetyl/propionyl-CoA carboxylase alpha subunit